jgi:hypothetical protein
MIFLHQKERLEKFQTKPLNPYSTSVSNKESLTRSKNKMKITEAELGPLDQLIIINKETTALQAKRELNIRATRSVQNYLNKLGWKKIQHCQFVSDKKRIERVFFCAICQLTNSIFIDECTVSMTYNGRFQWHISSGIASETRSGLKSKYKHEAPIHVLGGISRKGPAKLIIFSG